jgi:hypothetical protein
MTAPRPPLSWLDALLTWLDARASEPAPLWPGGPAPSDYAAGLLRPTGSYIKDIVTPQDLRALFAAVASPTEVTDSIAPSAKRPNHRYWTAPVPSGYAAYEAVAPLSTLTDAELSEVRVTRAPHGLELQAPTIPARPAATLTFITEANRLVTWHPGPPLPPIPLEQAAAKLRR